MTALDNLVSVLPMPYTTDPDALVTRFLGVCAAVLEAAEEDVERMRRSHWIERAYRGVDVDKLAALVGVERFQGEPTPIFRQRVAVLIAARRNGAVGPRQIRQFVYDYLVAMERLLECTLVPGLRSVPNENAWSAIGERPLFRHLVMIENPPRLRRSVALQDTAGRATHLHRWTETNRGLDEAPVTFRITGIGGGVTAMPSILNVTTGQLIGYRGGVRPGRTLTIETVNVAAEGAVPRWRARARMEGRNVSGRLYSINPFVFGADHVIETASPAGLILERGANEFMYFAPAMLNMPALDYVSFMVGDPDLREAVLDQTRFDHSLLPTETVAVLEMRWTEAEAASFEVHIPRAVVVEATAMNRELHACGMRPPHEEVAGDIEDMLPSLRAAGVRAELRFDAFRERQEQADRVIEPGRMEFDPERASAGRDRFGISALFDTTPLRLARLS